MKNSGVIRILNMVNSDTTRILVTHALQHYDMRVVSSDRQGLFRHLHQKNIDLIILDIRDRRSEEISTLRQILAASIPVIVTDDGQRGADDRVAMLELGADDYMSEPISPRELVARVRAVLRRRGKPRAVDALSLVSGGFCFAEMTLDLRTRQLTRSDGTHIRLSSREYALLFALLSEAGRTLSREGLLNATRLHQDVSDRTIDVLVLRLRRKIEGYPARQRIIKTERGVGYSIVSGVERLT